MFGFGFGFISNKLNTKTVAIAPPDPDSLALVLFNDGDTVGLDGDQDPDELGIVRPSNVRLSNLFLLDQDIQSGEAFGAVGSNTRMLPVDYIVDLLES
ncbi:hypothetical protein P11VFA_151 [Rhizobium phage P11VFA]|nr:hypothetical protein P11VFA_151 [Rhizobium phage P11VFA]